MFAWTRLSVRSVWGLELAEARFRGLVKAARLKHVCMEQAFRSEPCGLELAEVAASIRMDHHAPRACLATFSKTVNLSECNRDSERIRIRA